MTTFPGHSVTIVPPTASAVPLIVSSPHSGRIYPPELLAASALEAATLRRLEDVAVDDLFGSAPAAGAVLLAARYARAFVDTNREPLEIDRHLLADPVPDGVNCASAKARAGLGTIPSRLGHAQIYRRPLPLAVIEERIERAYWPFHEALATLLDAARGRFGFVLLLDCHSMPSSPIYQYARSNQIDFALGDRFGRACSPEIVDWAERFLRGQGFRVARNRPYAGGFITSHYGRPNEDRHALQIEVRRGLYMDEDRLEPNAAMPALRRILDGFVAGLADLSQRLSQEAEAA